ncbi:hypothetical protein [Nocardia farcinica]|uniref:Uncharacterized protein n=1 Tax=Nocardia farcinica (strain IFM 10152) TaxID=247156 RepID=Q5Z3Y0_NOCFA|nr:hypothetical protein [Nocardia farcinica]BAD54861.1 hypothetical protein NFA_190 [Nocardia farcinica IFM 10152]
MSHDNSTSAATAMVTAALRVTLASPVGTSTRLGDRMSIGTLVIRDDDGRVEAIPFRDIDAEDTHRLVSIAAAVAVTGRPDHPAWSYCGGVGWAALVIVPVPPPPSEIRTGRADLARAMLDDLRTRPAREQRHVDFFVRIAHQNAIPDAEIARRLGLSEDAVRACLSGAPR